MLPFPLNGERLRGRGVTWIDENPPWLQTEVVGIPTPHPAFGHLLPVEGRRNATNASSVV
jgi:hypothetical protein